MNDNPEQSLFEPFTFEVKPRKFSPILKLIAIVLVILFLALPFDTVYQELMNTGGAVIEYNCFGIVR
jgi:hypothetical protein